MSRFFYLIILTTPLVASTSTCMPSFKTLEAILVPIEAMVEAVYALFLGEIDKSICLMIKKYPACFAGCCFRWGEDA